jgi:hypothetical protein
MGSCVHHRGDPHPRPCPPIWLPPASRGEELPAKGKARERGVVGSIPKTENRKPKTENPRPKTENPNSNNQGDPLDGIDQD